MVWHVERMVSMEYQIIIGNENPGADDTHEGQTKLRQRWRGNDETGGPMKFCLVKLLLILKCCILVCTLSINAKFCNISDRYKHHACALHCTYLLLFVDANLSNFHSIWFLQVCPHCINYIDIIHLTALNAVRFHQLGRIFQYCCGDVINCLSLLNTHKYAANLLIH